MKHLPWLAAAALALGGLAASTGHTKAPPVALGFLDVGRAFDTYGKTKTVMDQLKDKSAKYLAKLKQRAGEVDEKSSKLHTLNPGSPEYAALDREISFDKAGIKIDEDFMQREIEEEKRKKLLGIYRELCQESQNYGAEHELAAVMLYIPADTDFGQNLEVVMNTRTVLCRDDQLDVTKAIVDRLNAQLPPAPPANPGTDNPPPPK